MFCSARGIDEIEIMILTFQPLIWDPSIFRAIANILLTPVDLRASLRFRDI